MRKLVAAVSALATTLGLLWLFQGLGLVHVRPILCFADCAEVQGPSMTWAIVGFVLAISGAWGVSRGFTKR